MDITELYHFISEVAEELPELESKQLLEIRDSLEELGPNEWTGKLALFANEMLVRNVGNWEKLMILESEAENSGSIEIKLHHFILFIVLIGLGIYYV